MPYDIKETGKKVQKRKIGGKIVNIDGYVKKKKDEFF